jgi:hypothetical protein
MSPPSAPVREHGRNIQSFAFGAVLCMTAVFRNIQLGTHACFLETLAGKEHTISTDFGFPP